MVQPISASASSVDQNQIVNMLKQAAQAGKAGGSGGTPRAGGPPKSGAPGASGVAKGGGTSKASTQTTISEDDLENLTPDQIKAKLTLAVKAGTLTQAQADAMLQRILQHRAESERAAAKGEGAGKTNQAGSAYAPNGMPPHREAPPEIKAVAEKLEMSVEDLGEALHSGKILSDLAKEKGLSVQDLNDVAAKAAKTHLDQAVKDGKMDQATADAIVSNIQTGEWLGPGLGPAGDQG